MPRWDFRQCHGTQLRPLRCELQRMRRPPHELHFVRLALLQLQRNVRQPLSEWSLPKRDGLFGMRVALCDLRDGGAVPQLFGGVLHQSQLRECLRVSLGHLRQYHRSKLRPLRLKLHHLRLAPRQLHLVHCSLGLLRTAVPKPLSKWHFSKWNFVSIMHFSLQLLHHQYYMHKLRF